MIDYKLINTLLDQNMKISIESNDVTSELTWYCKSIESLISLAISGADVR